ncbi:MAG TPA: histone deacetylase [Planctomycetaceae bacterium]|nr:histone deacetylase [Planctomycetaceae bacterium]
MVRSGLFVLPSLGGTDMALLHISSLYEQHRTGMHPESPARIRALREMLAETGLDQKLTPLPLAPIDLKTLELIHPAEYIAAIREYAAQGGGRIEADTVVSPDSYNVALHAAGAAVSAVERVLTTDESKAVCLIRPPGHHASRVHPMGFCLFSNVAVAAQAAIERHDLSRVLIVDWDVHHGNGTQDIFYEDERVHFFSAHRYPFYPGTGADDETGSGKGLGTIWNLPLAFGISQTEFHDEFQRMLEQAAARCRPELILISAGFDMHRDDPVGSLGLDEQDFVTLTRTVCDVADQYCGGRVVSLLEGGYNLTALAASVKVHLETLLEREVEK